MDEKVNTGYEVQDANVREVVLTGVGLAVATLVVFLLMWGLFNAFKNADRESQSISPMSQPGTVPPEPRLQVAPMEDLGILREREEQMLGSYGWVDKNAGKVRIPIEKAMDTIAEKGIPAPTVKGNAKH